ncbi:hypothetical protein Sjap_001215 [Stephania japonica]|uniref:Uncharacterized protein n=1 Tax=Stephania japonica TaxID=461633 RepID=A0AAP0KM28_9MAGN
MEDFLSFSIIKEFFTVALEKPKLENSLFEKFDQQKDLQCFAQEKQLDCPDRLTSD